MNFDAIAELSEDEIFRLYEDIIIKDRISNCACDESSRWTDPDSFWSGNGCEEMARILNGEAYCNDYCLSRYDRVSVWTYTYCKNDKCPNGTYGWTYEQIVERCL